MIYFKFSDWTETVKNGEMADPSFQQGRRAYFQEHWRNTLRLISTWDKGSILNVNIWNHI